LEKQTAKQLQCKVCVKATLGHDEASVGAQRHNHVTATSGVKGGISEEVVITEAVLAGTDLCNRGTSMLQSLEVRMWCFPGSKTNSVT
jgi:hypothetical protein